MGALIRLGTKLGYISLNLKQQTGRSDFRIWEYAVIITMEFKEEPL